MTDDTQLELEVAELQRVEVSERVGDKVQAHELALKDREIRLARVNYVACGSDRALTVIFTCVPWVVGWFVWFAMQ